MRALELYTLVNSTLGILAWPITTLIAIAMLRKPVVAMVNRFAQLEGSIGAFSFKISLEQYVQETVSKAVDLEKQGRSAEAKALVQSASDIASLAIGVSSEDAHYLLALADGEAPKSRWGKVHLVRAGLVELDGGALTPRGREFVETFVRPSLERANLQNS